MVLQGKAADKCLKAPPWDLRESNHSYEAQANREVADKEEVGEQGYSGIKVAK